MPRAGRPLPEPFAALSALLRPPFHRLASHGGAPAPRRAAARTTHRLASHGGAPAPRRAAARTTHRVTPQGGACERTALRRERMQVGATVRTRSEAGRLGAPARAEEDEPLRMVGRRNPA